jgi:hypothetical protein
MTPSSEALILIGGTASRLRQAGVQMPRTKAFLEVADKPLLWWNLRLIHQSGIRAITLAGDTAAQLHQAAQIIRRLPEQFERVSYFLDFGLGVHGLPYQARHYVGPSCVVVCGHGLSTSAHYRKLIEHPASGLVFSRRRPHPSNSRQPVAALYGNTVSHPIRYRADTLHQLIEARFRIHNLIELVQPTSQNTVLSELPLEFDTPAEYAACLVEYQRHLGNIGMI